MTTRHDALNAAREARNARLSPFTYQQDANGHLVVDDAFLEHVRSRLDTTVRMNRRLWPMMGYCPHPMATALDALTYQICVNRSSFRWPENPDHMSDRLVFKWLQFQFRAAITSTTRKGGHGDKSWDMAVLAVQDEYRAVNDVQYSHGAGLVEAAQDTTSEVDDRLHLDEVLESLPTNMLRLVGAIQQSESDPNYGTGARMAADLGVSRATLTRRLNELQDTLGPLL